MIDWEHAYRLLHITNLARQWPNLQWLHDEAMKELQRGRPEEKPVPKPAPRPEPTPEPSAPEIEDIKRRPL